MTSFFFPEKGTIPWSLHQSMHTAKQNKLTTYDDQFIPILVFKMIYVDNTLLISYDKTSKTLAGHKGIIEEVENISHTGQPTRTQG